MAKNKFKNIIWGLALLLIGVKPSPFLFGQNADSTACEICKRFFSEKDLMSELEQNIPFFKEALLCLEAEKCWEDYIATLNTIAVAYYYKKEYQGARKYAEQAMTLTQEHFGENSVSYATSVANLSVFIAAMGNYKKSIELQLQSLDIDTRLGTDDNILAISQENIGTTYQNMGDFDLARTYFEQALQRTPQKGDSNKHNSGRLFRQIAACYWAKKEVKEALYFYQKSLALLEKLPREKFYEQTRWYAYRDLAEIHLEQKQLDLALQYIRKALDIQEQYDMLEAYKAYLTMGNVQLLSENKEEALRFFKQAEKAAQQEFTSYKKHPGLASPVAHQAKVYAQKKEYQLALEQYDKALELITLKAGQFTHPKEALQILEGRARFQYQRYLEEGQSLDLGKAFADHQVITEVLQSIRRNYFSEDPKFDLAERTVPIIAQGIAIALELYRIGGDAYYLEQAFAFAESNKAVLLSESLREDMARGFAGISDSLLVREEELRTEISFLKRRILEAQQQEQSEDLTNLQKWEHQVFELEKEYRKWTAKLEVEYPLYYNRKYEVEPVSIETLRKEILSDDSAIVEFMIGPEKSYTFFVTKEKIDVFPLENSATLAKAVSGFRQLITTPPAGPDFKENYQAFSRQSHQLYQQLMENGLSHLSSSIEHLIIVPDEQLCLLPFELLLRQIPATNTIDFAPANMEYLFEDYTISYHYSASLMATLESRARPQLATKKFIGFAPAFGDEEIAQNRTCAENNLSGLRCNRDEILAIQALIGGEALLSEEARLATFQQRVEDYQIVHLATHACIDAETAALSKIYLSDANLTPFELNNLRLKADLTVLSACNTGSGKVLKGEGVMSLARSFMLAGTQSVLTSLWSVNDCATSDLMIHYYEGLKKGWSKDVALNTAKMNYLKTADINGRHPSYWAGFIQFGDMEQLALPANRNFFFLKMLGLLLLLVFIVQRYWRSK